MRGWSSRYSREDTSGLSMNWSRTVNLSTGREGRGGGGGGRRGEERGGEGRGGERGGEGRGGDPQCYQQND